MNSLSRVIIVGQPNVGKSVLFNRLGHTNKAITSHVAHTTRDHNRGTVNHNGVQFELIDSAGFAKTEDELSKQAIAGLDKQIEQSDLVIFLADGTTELDNNDLKLSKMVLRSKKPVILAVNKSDKREFNNNQNHYRKLGFENIMLLSAQNGLGVSDLLDEIVTLIPRKKGIKRSNSIGVTILGRPNVGKSALLNALSKSNLALVSDIAGTTRDTNTAEINFHGTTLEFSDTAGLRRRGKIGTGIEFFSSTRTKQTIEKADICLVLIDGINGLTKQDEHIIGLVKDARKALIIVVTKWDAVAEKDDNLMTQVSNEISNQLQYVWWAPLIFTSSKSSQNLEKLKQLIVEINNKQNIKLPTTKLNSVIRSAVNNQPPVTTKGFHAKLNYITQTGTSPLQLTVFGTHPELIHFSYQRYLENQLRANFDLTGIPLQIVFKSKYKDK